MSFCIEVDEGSCVHFRYSPTVLDVYFGLEKVSLSRVPGRTLTISPADSQVLTPALV